MKREKEGEDFLNGEREREREKQKRERKREQAVRDQSSVLVLSLFA